VAESNGVNDKNNEISEILENSLFEINLSIQRSLSCLKENIYAIHEQNTTKNT
jgi:hypothetical protein